MTNALPHDVLLEKAAPLPAKRPSTSLAPVMPDSLPAFAVNNASIWKRLERMRMSEVDRGAAIDALLLGRDIGRALQHLEHAVRRWLGIYMDARHGRHASFRQLMRMRRARSHRGARAPRVR